MKSRIFVCRVYLALYVALFTGIILPALPPAIAQVSSTDADGDGTPNVDDIDDDNDGILDVNEMASVSSAANGGFLSGSITTVTANKRYTQTAGVVTINYNNINSTGTIAPYTEPTVNADELYATGTSISYVYPEMGAKQEMTFSQSGVPKSVYSKFYITDIDQNGENHIIKVYDQNGTIIANPESYIRRTAEGTSGASAPGTPTQFTDIRSQVTVTSGSGSVTVSSQSPYSSNTFVRSRIVFFDFSGIQISKIEVENVGTAGAPGILFDIIAVPRDTDSDGIPDHLDIDSDNDGITDNVEAQTTAGYIAPSGIGAAMTDIDDDGLDDRYDNNIGSKFTSTSVGLNPVDTDSDGTKDFRDTNSDGDSLNDIAERGDGQPISVTSTTDSDGDGLLNIFEGSSTTDFFDVNDENLNSGNFNLADTDNDTAANGAGAVPLIADLDYRDNVLPVDYGEAPNSIPNNTSTANSYKTILAESGARHTATGPFLGATRIAEANGVPVTFGSDITATDNDGVVFNNNSPVPNLITADVTGSRTNNITVTASGAGFVNAWVDFNQNGLFDVGEQIFTNQAVVAGSNSLTFTVPSTTIPGATYARFRFTSASVTTPSPSGLLPDGEVEDYRLLVAKQAQGPACSTETFTALNSRWFVVPKSTTSHKVERIGTLPNGTLVDVQITSDVAITAFDNLTANPPANGNTRFTMSASQTRNFTFKFYKSGTTTLVPGNFVMLFADIDGAGTTLAAPSQPTAANGERLAWKDSQVSSFELNSTTWVKDVTTATPPGTVPTGYSRQFGGIYDNNLSTDDNTNKAIRLFITNQDTVEIQYFGGQFGNIEANPQGITSVIPVCPSILDYSDAPTSGMAPSGITNNYGNATHTVVNTLKLGAAIDSETASIADATASGDGADDDGITLPNLTAGATSYSIPAANIIATGTGTLHAWIDFNKNGTFDTGEYKSVAINSNTPAGALSWRGITIGSVGNTFARFRLTTDSSVTSLTPSGAATNGEVEDYQVSIASILSVSGTVFNDANLDKSKGVSESGISDVTIVLRNTTTNTCQSVKTNQQGLYTFPTVIPGTYELLESANETTPTPGNCPSTGRDPSGYASTTPNLRQITVGVTSLIDQNFGDHLAPDFGLCPSPAYISQGTNADDVTLKGVNLLNGAVTTVGAGTIIPSANGIGFSQIDNFIYGSKTSKGSIYRVDSNGVGYDLGVVAGFSISNGYNVGDVDARGWLHLSQTNDTIIDVVDVNPNSTNFLKLIYQITLPQKLQIHDFAFHPTDGSLYTVRQAGTLSRINITYPPTVPTSLPGAISNVVVEDFTGLNPTLPAGPYGSVYFAQGGEFYFYRNSNGSTTTAGSIYTVTLPSNVPATTNLSVSTLTLNAPKVSQNDGARCANAPAPTVSNPNILLVKRITAINGSTATQSGGDNLSGYMQENNNPYDDNLIEPTLAPNLPSFPVRDTDKWPNTTGKVSSTFLVGGINGGTIKPNDKVEYTIYFLSSGTSEAKNVLFCDRVPANTTFIPNAFNAGTLDLSGLSTADRGIAINLGGSLKSYTNINDGDIARYYPPLSEPVNDFPKINCGGSNTNGAVVVNLGNVPNATAAGNPAGSYGFVRFQGRVK